MTTYYASITAAVTIFGGAQVTTGTSTIPTTNVTVKGGTVGTIYGGSHVTAGESIIGTSNVYFENGTMSRSYIYGGSNVSGGTSTVSVSNVTVEQNSRADGFPFVFGGGNGSGGTVINANVTIGKGNVGPNFIETVFGGGFLGGKVNKSDVTVNSGYIFSHVYGGGHTAPTDEGKITINGGDIGAVSAGGYSTGLTVAAPTVKSEVTVNGGEIIRGYSDLGISGGVYGGGSNETSSPVTESKIIVSGGVMNVLSSGPTLGGNEVGKCSIYLTGGTVKDGVKVTESLDILTVSGCTASVFGTADRAKINVTNGADLTIGVADSADTSVPTVFDRFVPASNTPAKNLTLTNGSTLTISGGSSATVLFGFELSSDASSRITISKNAVMTNNGTIAGDVYNSGSFIAGPESTVTGEIYDVKPSPPNLTISFDTNGGGNIPDRIVPYGSVLGDLPTAYKSGYGFVGWTYNGKTVNSSTVVTESMVLKATYVLIPIQTPSPEPTDGQTATVVIALAAVLVLILATVVLKKD